MTSVTSSNIAEVDYVDGELRVHFKDSDFVYVYPGVSRETYDALLAAPSIGSYFHHNVKKVTPPHLVRKEPLEIAPMTTASEVYAAINGLPESEREDVKRQLEAILRK